VEEEEEREGCSGSNGEIEVEAPPPAYQVGEDSSKKRASRCTYSEPGTRISFPSSQLKERGKYTYINPTTAVKTGRFARGTA
jgi:hypothetical protein